MLEAFNISCEIVDVQTLLPFDIHHKILDSLKKTNRILFIDEDVPGGAAAYMFNKVLEEQELPLLRWAPERLPPKLTGLLWNDGIIQQAKRGRN